MSFFLLSFLVFFLSFLFFSDINIRVLFTFFFFFLSFFLFLSFVTVISPRLCGFLYEYWKY